MRTERLVVKLSPEMKEKLKTMAQERGITMTELVAYALGDFVVKELKDENQKL